MFNLMMFLDIADGQPGMFVPLFSAPHTNLPYVQQMDEFLMVKEILPFLEYEHYPIVAANDRSQTINIGERGLIAFRSFDGSIITGNVEEVLRFISANAVPLSHHPILRSQLHRIESAELNPSYEVWRSVAAAVFADQDQQKFWIDSEIQLFQKQKKIWAEIEPIDTRKDKGGQESIYASISEYGTEFLVRWLSNRTNYNSRDWTKVWHYTNAKALFDVRVTQAALNWIFYLGDTDADLQQCKSVIYAVLDKWYYADAHTPPYVNFPELASFLEEKLTFDLSLIFEFLRPKSFLQKLLTFLALEGDVSDVVRIVDFCAEQLPKDGAVLEILIDTLGVLYQEIAPADFEEDTPQPEKKGQNIREFDQKELETILNVAERLTKLAGQQSAS